VRERRRDLVDDHDLVRDGESCVTGEGTIVPDEDRDESMDHLDLRQANQS